MTLFKRILVGLICTAICAYSTWKSMQILAIVSLSVIVFVIFKAQATRVLEICLRLIQSTKQAKLGQLEFNIDENIQDISSKLSTNAAWVKILLSQFKSDEIGLLLSIFESKEYEPIEAIKDKLRILRKYGLIQHNKSTLAASNKVWLTSIGNEFASNIKTAVNSSKTNDN